LVEPIIQGLKRGLDVGKINCQSGISAEVTGDVDLHPK